MLKLRSKRALAPLMKIFIHAFILRSELCGLRSYILYAHTYVLYAVKTFTLECTLQFKRLSYRDVVDHRGQ